MTNNRGLLTFVTNKLSANIDAFSSDGHDLFSFKKLFGNNGRKTTEEMAAAINNDLLFKAHVVCRLLVDGDDQGDNRRSPGVGIFWITCRPTTWEHSTWWRSVSSLDETETMWS